MKNVLILRMKAAALLTTAMTAAVVSAEPSSPPPVKDSAVTGTAWKNPGPELLETIFGHARQGTVEAVQIYLESGYTPNPVNARGDSLLIVAAYHGHTGLVKLLCSQKGIEVDFQNKMGFTALTGAAFKGSVEIAGELLAAGADVNHTNASGQTALMFAALTGRDAVAELLLAKGADRTLDDRQGLTAAMLAAQQGAEALAKKLE